jgi:hypothetical protein
VTCSHYAGEPEACAAQEGSGFSGSRSCAGHSEPFDVLKHFTSIRGRARCAILGGMKASVFTARKPIECDVRTIDEGEGYRDARAATTGAAMRRRETTRGCHLRIFDE